MTFKVESSNQPAVLANAILLYQSTTRHQSSTTFASLHNVRNCGTVKRPDIKIMPGAPLTEEALKAVLQSLGKRQAISVDLLPETVLSHSPEHLVWWLPAAKRTVHFENNELGKRSAVVPHPPLLFSVCKGVWSVFALDNNLRPTKTSVLCYAPYFNVYDNGSICRGSAKTPAKVDPALINRWEAAFFDSAFTHINGKTVKVAHPDGEYAFWKAMLDGHYQEFPHDLLIATGGTLATHLKHIIGRLAGT